MLDVGGAESDGVGRLLADLGADVLKIEPPGGSSARRHPPAVAGVGIPFALDNANKRCAELDAAVAEDRDRLVDLVAEADVVVDGGRPGGLSAFGTSAAELADRFGHLVALSVTDFGTDGPYASWEATDSVLYAMSTALSRSGPTVGRPVLPPHGIASTTAAAQAAWAVLVAYFHRLRSGRGDSVDLARFEAVVQTLDPPFGSEGQAAVGLKASNQLWRGRPRNQQIYPTFRCRDGHVRLCVLSARQWRGMRAWLGEPARFADPAFDTIGARYAASAELNALIAARFADASMDDLVAEGRVRGVPIAAVLSPTEALASEHLRAVGALRSVRLADGPPLDVPVGAFVIDGAHAGLRHPAPAAAGDRTEWLPRPHPAPDVGTADETDRPFAGLRILDLGVIVAGGELGRLFADLGADVIKVESAAYPDGLRQTAPGQQMSRSWALTHRNERSLGLDLRHPLGAAVFRRLVASADAVFANFKPGTLDSLGFSLDELRAANPRIVLAESSAFGATGPWSERMGYGPLVRATTGVSRLWSDRHPGRVASGSSEPRDATTIFPDHVAAKLTAIAALAALIGRRGVGSRVHVSQAEVAVNQLAASFVADAARAGGADVRPDDAVDAVLPCAGDDEWCVVSLTDASHRSTLATLLGLAEVPADDADLVDAAATWTGALDKSEATRVLQAAGIPAGPMNRAVDVLTDPQLEARAAFGRMDHPLFDAPMPTEIHPAPFRHVPDADLRPAPMPGEHTAEICRDVLGMSAEEVAALAATGAVFAWAGSEHPLLESTP
ncbi:CoA transferase [Mycolicibacterium sediminis]|uniref:Putative CoA-transferase n=1 Tax=Mycolicibacterium sediminis TaxID=1286180 RepID=A0A7I7QUW3_9MYCO|nr:putative CoA-transferase [Mycolicibacterium sediminis]